MLTIVPNSASRDCMKDTSSTDLSLPSQIPQNHASAGFVAFIFGTDRLLIWHFHQ